MSHYETLNVPSDASAEDIKAAYRRAARDAHPDRAGGDTEQMAKVNRAYQVLSDPETRQHYDQTGGEPGQGPDPVTSTLAELFEMAIDGCDGDVIDFCNQKITDALEELDHRQSSADKSIAKLTKKRDRVRAKGNGENLFTALIDSKLTTERGLLAQVAATRKTMLGARERLNDYESTYVPPAAPSKPGFDNRSHLEDLMRDMLRKHSDPFGGRRGGRPW